MIGRAAAWTGLIVGTLATFWGLLTLVGTRTPVGGGVVLGAGLLVAAAGFALLIRSSPAAAEDAGPDTGRRKLLAQQRGWRYSVTDDGVGERYPHVGLSRNAPDNAYSRVISGQLDGVPFDVFNHAYAFGGGAVRHEETVFLLRLAPCATSFSVEGGNRVMPADLEPVVLTAQLRRAAAKAKIRDWSLVDSMLVYAEPVIPDRHVARIPRRLADLRAVAAAIPAIVFD